MLSLALVLGVTGCNKEQEKKVECKATVEQVQPKDDLNGKKPREIDSSINYDEYVDTKDKLIKVIKKLHETRGKEEIVFLGNDKSQVENFMNEYDKNDKKTAEDNLVVGDMKFVKDSSIGKPIFSMKLKSVLNEDFRDEPYSLEFTYKYIDKLNELSEKVKGKDDFETVKNLAKVLIDDYRYDPQLSSTFGCDLLLNKEGTCNSFSELANDVLNNCGIYSEIWWVDSMPDDELDKNSNPYRNHSIDRARLNGKMYFLDFTHSTISHKNAKDYGFENRPKLIMEKLPEVERGKNQLYTGYSKVREPILVNKGFCDGHYSIDNPYAKYSDLGLGWTTYGQLLDNLRKNPYFK